jgi:hypothetical protein
MKRALTAVLAVVAGYYLMGLLGMLVIKKGGGFEEVWRFSHGTFPVLFVWPVSSLLSYGLFARLPWLRVPKKKNEENA